MLSPSERIDRGANWRCALTKDGIPFRTAARDARASARIAAVSDTAPIADAIREIHYSDILRGGESAVRSEEHPERASILVQTLSPSADRIGWSEKALGTRYGSGPRAVDRRDQHARSTIQAIERDRSTRVGENWVDLGTDRRGAENKRNGYERSAQHSHITDWFSLKHATSIAAAPHPKMPACCNVRGSAAQAGTCTRSLMCLRFATMVNVITTSSDHELHLPMCTLDHAPS
jgi:hypothetical protein